MKERNEINWQDIEPSCVIRGILNHIILVILAALIGVMGVRLTANVLYTPEYSSSVTFAVTSRSGLTTTYNNLNAASEMSVVFSQILESSLMSERICQELGVSSMPGILKAETQGQTNMLVVTATAGSPKDAFLMVQTVKEHYSDFSDLIDQSAVLQIMSDAQVSTTPINPMNVRRNMVRAAAACAVLAVLTLAWMNIARDTIQNRSAARHKLDGTVLVTVPHENRRRQGGNLLISSPEVSFFFEETFFRLRSAVEASVERSAAARQEGRRGAVILVTSAAPGEGKSTVAADLALALAKKHPNVLLIDADLRNPTQVGLFGDGAVQAGGLQVLLQAPEVTLDGVSRAATYSKAENIALLLNKKRSGNPAELLASPNMARLVELMRENMDYIVIDSPPYSMFAEGISLADLADASILVVRQDRAAAADINDTIDALNQSRSKFLGLVLNDMKSLVYRSHGRDYGYSYGYGYGYGKKQGYGYGYGDRSSGGKQVEG